VLLGPSTSPENSYFYDSLRNKAKTKANAHVPSQYPPLAFSTGFDLSIARQVTCSM
jgi:hypothetical protein